MRTNLPEWAVWLDVPVNQARESVRHRALYGGRGGAKSWTIAHKLVERARLGPVRILCTREFQNSIRDSSKKLLEDCINRMGFGPRGDRFFTITEREIRGRNGSLFTFLGLNGKDQSIKSLEGYDLAWVEEAATLRQASIDALVPTIRRDGSEIWWSYNPRYASDPVDQMFRGDGPPPGSVIVPVGFADNPWFPEVLRRDMEYDRGRDPEKHAHVWLGRYVVRSDAQVFRNWSQVPFESPADAPLDWAPTGASAPIRRSSCAALSVAGADSPAPVTRSPIPRGCACLSITKLTRSVAQSMTPLPCLLAMTPGSLNGGATQRGGGGSRRLTGCASLLTALGRRRSTICVGVDLTLLRRSREGARSRTGSTSSRAMTFSSTPGAGTLLTSSFTTAGPSIDRPAKSFRGWRIATTT